MTVEPSAASLIRELQVAEIFRLVRTDRLDDLARASRTVQLETGQFLFRPDSPASDLVVLLSGAVRCYRQEENGRELTLELVFAGDTVGEPGLFAEDSMRRVYAVAVEPTTGLVVPKEPFFRFLEANPRAMRWSLAKMSRILKGQTENFSGMAVNDLRRRLAYKLLTLSQARGEITSVGTRITIPLSQTMLAGMVGASRQKVNRALGELVAAGHIAFRSRYYTVLQPLELQRIFDADEALP